MMGPYMSGVLGLSAEQCERLGDMQRFDWSDR